MSRSSRKDSGTSPMIRANSLSPVRRDYKRLELALAEATDIAKKRLRAKSTPPPFYRTLKSINTPHSSKNQPRNQSSDPPRPHSAESSQGFVSLFQGGSHTLKEELIHSYDYFHYRIQELTTKADKTDPVSQIILLFTANDKKGASPQHAKTWCKDCNFLETLISEFLSPKKDGYLVRVKVGNMAEWMSPYNPYRTDNGIRLTSIPTIIVWNTGKRLSGKGIYDVNELLTIFDPNLEADPWTRTKELEIARAQRHGHSIAQSGKLGFSDYHH